MSDVPRLTYEGNGNGHANRSTKAEVRSRVLQFIELLWMGAQWQDLVTYSTNQGWGVKPDALRKYRKAAYKQIEKSMNRKRGRVVSLHELQRNRLYTLALDSGKLELAHQILMDLAKMQGVNEPKGRFNDDDGRTGKANDLAARLRSAVERRRNGAVDGSTNGTVP